MVEVRIAKVGAYLTNIERIKQLSRRREVWRGEKGWETSMDFKVYNKQLLLSRDWRTLEACNHR